MDSAYAKAAIVSSFVGLMGLASYGVVQQTREIGEGRIVMATGSSQYLELAESYRDDMERLGIKFEVRRDTEGFKTLRALLDPSSGINAGFIKGGLVGSLQGRLASEKAKGRHAQYGKLYSVGRVFYEPIWVFTRKSEPVTSLRELKGKKIYTGTRESGTRRVARFLLLANGVDDSNSTMVPEILPGDAAPLFDGRADAAILIEPPDTETMQMLLKEPNIQLMDFSSEAESYDNRFPAIGRVVLRRGAVEFNPLLPPSDITLLTTTAALVVRADMHPALISLLTQAVINNPRSGFDDNGDPVLFFKSGQFPTVDDPEFQVSKDTRSVYKNGDLPLVLRHLAPLNAQFGVPFSFTAFAHSYAARALLILIPLLALLLPLMRALPALYVWMVRRRLVYWYRQLKKLERTLDSRGGKYDLEVHQAEIERIDSAVRRIRVPNYFSNELYDLRLHINLVRQRLNLRPSLPMAAE
jgi:TRAP-type uncharacterized transport system substrate-binding protein